MNSLARLGALGALALTLTSLASADLLPPDEACAPDGMRLPTMSLLLREGLAPLAHLQTDPSLAGGIAVLFINDPFGPKLPRGICSSSLRGRIDALVPINGEGRAVWQIPASLAGTAPALRALAWGPGGTWVETHVSKAVQLPLGQSKGAGALMNLVISEFQKDPTTVSDSKGEWIEITNLGLSAVDIEGWTLADLGTDATVLDAGGAGIIVPAGGRVVLGREGDTTLNGGIPVDAVYSGVTLSNGEDELVLIRPDGWVADQLMYDDGVNWPDEPGRAISLLPGAHDAQMNDDGANWCSATTVVGAGPDTGTPGAGNDDCGG
jgi:Lamin Tail Domain